jgi:hypothetical protein
MFKKTDVNTQIDLFKSTSNVLSGKAMRVFEDQMAWHNLFRVNVTSRIDETIFSPLFSKGMGAPNASIRVMVSMMILKEGNGWSDEQLFEQCSFNLLVRSALGFINLDEKIPAESTYYFLRKKVGAYKEETGINLFDLAFTSLTKGQAIDFEVSGKSIRMDSKLLGSNIAWLSRYELIHETIRLFCLDIKDTIGLYPALSAHQMTINNVLNEQGNKVVYRSTDEEVKTKLHDLGLLAHALIPLYNSLSSVHYDTLKRVFSEQFQVSSDGMSVTARKKEEISTDSVQSPHDTDCHYRNKDGNQVKGYTINLTESTDNDKLNLITNVEVKVASSADNSFLETSVQNTQEIVVDKIENIHADGAYHSPDNQAFCTLKHIELLINAIQGPQPRYDLELSQTGQLIVIDNHTSQTIPATKAENKEKWRIKHENKYRYFTQKEITAANLRKKIANIPQEILNKRNNVEATIFQLGYHYPNDKTRYRGILKHKMWAIVRCMWVNFVRIKNFINLKPIHANFETIYHTMRLFIVQIIAQITMLEDMLFKYNSSKAKPFLCHY